MARFRVAARAAGAGALAVALAVSAGAWTSSGRGEDGARQLAAIVRVTNLGLERVTEDPPRVLVWTSGAARVGVGDAEPAALTDTLQLSSLPAMTADVTEGDVHIRLVTPGRMRIGGEVTGGGAIRFTATGRHIVLLKGGVGADTITDP